MPRALRDLRRRIIGQPIIPGMQSGITGAHGIVLVPPGVKLVRELVQRHRIRRALACACYRAWLHVRGRLGNERLVRNVRRSFRRHRFGLNRLCCSDDNHRDAEKKMIRLHVADFN